MNTLSYLKTIFPLLDAVQKAKIYTDQKTMVDAVPKFPVLEIMKTYTKKVNYTAEELSEFVTTHFDVIAKSSPNISSQSALISIEEHIEKLWDILTHTSESNKGTLLQLPYPYIVPGGRFVEFFYWDSYYIMLGLKTAGRFDMMNNIVDNCTFLIEKYGFIPNANRTYFLSRSQPPYFSMMLDLLFESKKDSNIYIKYFKILEKEYKYWMKGNDNLANQTSYKRVIKTKDGMIINRHYDEDNTPRPESFTLDLENSKKSINKYFLRNIIAACESGWDFSSRWFDNPKKIDTIQTLSIAPIDLNCLLWHMENTLSNTAKKLNNKVLQSYYLDKATQRKEAIQTYFWDAERGIFTDYLFDINKVSSSDHIACLFPLFFGLATKEQALQVAKIIELNFLKAGGLVTTTIDSGQQWDSPNAWAPYQWIGYKAMLNYGFTTLAEKIKNNWCSNVKRVYQNTGRLMEKYNAIDTQINAGGGEYPNQDGFGWTNAVYITLQKL